MPLSKYYQSPLVRLISNYDGAFDLQGTPLTAPRRHSYRWPCGDSALPACNHTRRCRLHAAIRCSRTATALRGGGTGRQCDVSSHAPSNVRTCIFTIGSLYIRCVQRAYSWWSSGAILRARDGIARYCGRGRGARLLLYCWRGGKLGWRAPGRLDRGDFGWDTIFAGTLGKSESIIWTGKG